MKQIREIQIAKKRLKHKPLVKPSSNTTLNYQSFRKFKFVGFEFGFNMHIKLLDN